MFICFWKSFKILKMEMGILFVNYLIRVLIRWVYVEGVLLFVCLKFVDRLLLILFVKVIDFLIELLFVDVFLY